MVVAINKRNGLETREVVSKELMFKGDAERLANYLNKKDSVFNDNGDGFWYIVTEYKKEAK
jgi:hypothetical protein